MKTNKLIRILALSFLFIAAQVLFLTNPLVSKAQSKSNPPKLEGTEWEFKIKQTAEGLLTLAFYKFGKGDAVELLLVTTNAVGVAPRIQYNSQGIGTTEEGVFQPGRTEVVPGISPGAFTTAGSIAGTYRQNGSSVHLEFSDHSVDATIVDNRMEGYFLIKQSNTKQKWEARNTSGSIKSSNESLASSSAPSSSSLSMLQRVPKQLGEFKQNSPLMFHHCSPNPDKPSNKSSSIDLTGGIYEKDPLKDCAKGDVENLAAAYGENEIVISVTKYEDSAKATEAMVKQLKTSPEIVKREPMKNRAGQTVGELVMLQFDGKAITFTFDRYKYLIISKKPGDAQKVLKLLLLE